MAKLLSFGKRLKTAGKISEILLAAITRKSSTLNQYHAVRLNLAALI